MAIHLMYINITGFGLKNLCILVLWMQVAPALEGLRVLPEIVPCSSDTFNKKLRNENDFTKYLKENY